jgi:hypothetical protein
LLASTILSGDGTSFAERPMPASQALPLHSVAFPSGSTLILPICVPDRNPEQEEQKYQYG